MHDRIRDGFPGIHVKQDLSVEHAEGTACQIQGGHETQSIIPPPGIRSADRKGCQLHDDDGDKLGIEVRARFGQFHAKDFVPGEYAAAQRYYEIG